MTTNVLTWATFVGLTVVLTMQTIRITNNIRRTK